MKIVLIPDSFKGSISAKENCEISKKAILSVFPKCEVISLPISDGGEGFSESLLNIFGGNLIKTQITGPNFKKINSFFGMINENTAVIEVAAAAGYLQCNPKTPMTTTSIGVGELILQAVEKGAKTIYLGLGGSGTNDAGVGIAHKLGVEFLNKNGKNFIPTGSTLNEIFKINLLGIKKEIKDLKIIILCDVKNFFHGNKGAAKVYAKQKGATDDEIEILDKNCGKFAKLLKRDFNFNAQFEGGGAAGGIAVCLKAFFNTEIKSGIETILDLIKFDSIIKNADLVITGEGKLDNQSLQGKVVGCVAKHCNRLNKPIIAIAGQVKDFDDKLLNAGFLAVYQLMQKGKTIEHSIQSTPVNLHKTIIKICNQLKNFKPTKI